MAASSVAPRPASSLDPRTWAWWQLPGQLRWYVALLPLVALAIFATAVSRTQWTSDDLARFGILTAGGMVSIAATPRMAFKSGTVTHDFIAAWVLPVAVLLPPAYALVAPIPLLVLTRLHIYRGVVHRMVFSGATQGLAYCAGSLFFHALPVAIAGQHMGTGRHALTWAMAVLACELIGGWGHRLLIHLAIKIADPSGPMLSTIFDREALTCYFVEHNLGIVITVMLAVTPAFAIFAIPLWLLVRRFMVYPHLVARARIDGKTGLLNSSSWEAEATAEIARATRQELALSVALIDLDHFKKVNDVHGHLAGDDVLRAVTGAISDGLRSYDLAGRFGGEEFIVLLPNASQTDAFRVAERLRTHIAALSVPVTSQGEGGPCVRVTVSIGVAALDSTRHELTNLVAAADAALYRAKQEGRNRTRVNPVSPPPGTQVSLAPSVPQPRIADPSA
ncbi:MAG TPA: diguanylate cyclase [Streptosporangiaceae bacterium]|jgi:diguanylate cyclase (GGDEF)-like protein